MREKPWLLMISGPWGRQKFKLFTDAPVRIGASPDNDVVIAREKAADDRHLVVEFRNGLYLAEDLGSASGTRYRGGKILVHTVSDRDVLTVGETNLEFLSPNAQEDLLGSGGPRRASPPKEPARSPEEAARSSAPLERRRTPASLAREPESPAEDTGAWDEDETGGTVDRPGDGIAASVAGQPNPDREGASESPAAPRRFGRVQLKSLEGWSIEARGEWGAKRHSLENKTTRVGASPENDLSLPEDSELKRFHMVIEPYAGAFIAEGVEGEVSHEDKTVFSHKIKDGDTLVIGASALTFHAAKAPPAKAHPGKAPPAKAAPPQAAPAPRKAPPGAARPAPRRATPRQGGAGAEPPGRRRRPSNPELRELIARMEKREIPKAILARYLGVKTADLDRWTAGEGRIAPLSQTLCHLLLLIDEDGEDVIALLERTARRRRDKLRPPPADR